MSTCCKIKARVKCVFHYEHHHEEVLRKERNVIIVVNLRCCRYDSFLSNVVAQVTKQSRCDQVGRMCEHYSFQQHGMLVQSGPPAPQCYHSKKLVPNDYSSRLQQLLLLSAASFASTTRNCNCHAIPCWQETYINKKKKTRTRESIAW